MRTTFLFLFILSLQSCPFGGIGKELKNIDLLVGKWKTAHQENELIIQITKDSLLKIYSIKNEISNKIKIRQVTTSVIGVDKDEVHIKYIPPNGKTGFQIVREQFGSSKFRHYQYSIDGDILTFIDNFEQVTLKAIRCAKIDCL